MNRAEKTNQYIGVVKTKNGYSSYINVNYKRILLGVYADEISAALKYDSYAKENNLNRRLNFPEPEPENLIPNTRLVRLTQGKFAIVDEEDFERVNQYNWFADRFKHSWYAHRVFTENGIRKNVKMHRFILGESDLYVDHKNGNGIHNYKSNLRFVSKNQNQYNRRIQDDCNSKYKGVAIKKNRFQSRIMVNNKPINLGYFSDEIEAAKAYDNAAKKYFGEYARLNFNN